MTAAVFTSIYGLPVVPQTYRDIIDHLEGLEQRFDQVSGDIQLYEAYVKESGRKHSKALTINQLRLRILKENYQDNLREKRSLELEINRWSAACQVLDTLLHKHRLKWARRRLQKCKTEALRLQALALILNKHT